MKRLPGTGEGADIYAITDGSLSLGRPVEEMVGAFLDAGIRIVQYREKDKSREQMIEECRILRKLTESVDACLIVNDHVEVAILSGADGVHIGQDDMPLPVVRQLVGEDMIIGVSTHTPEQAASALLHGANYIGVGPIYPTQTKKDVCEPVTLEYLDWIVEHCPLPFAAIGGINRGNIREVIAHGASCCAMISELNGAPDVTARVAELRAEMTEGFREAGKRWAMKMAEMKKRMLESAKARAEAEKAGKEE